MPWGNTEADFYRKTDERIMSTGEAQLNFEESITLPDGSTRWLSTSKVPIFDKANQKIVGVLGWFMDITQFKNMKIEIDEKNKALLEYSSRLEETNTQLEQSKNELQGVNYDLEKFTYAVSHDLKAPIRSILSFSELIKNQIDKGAKEKAKKNVDIIINSGKRMSTLVKDILNYARTGAKNLTTEHTNILSLVESKILDLEELRQSKDARIILKLEDEVIDCYPHLIGIVFFNLINNAIKFNESRKPIVVCTCTSTETDWEFSISDNGIGIEPKFNEKVFDPFTTLNGSTYEGSGIGLSMCKRVINLHKGKIWIEKNPVRGTNIKFTIPKNLKNL